MFVARWLIGAGVLVCALLLASCGGSASVEGPAAPPPDHGSLAVGITEPNASLIVSPRARPDLPQPFAAFRDRLVSLRPRYYRLFVDWPGIQPANAAPDFSSRQAGCLRAEPPCEPYAGVRAQFEAIASDQRQFGGFRLLVVITGTPAWAAAAPTGCEPEGTLPRARMPDVDTYRRFVAGLLALARETGVDAPYWSPSSPPRPPASPGRRRHRGRRPPTRRRGPASPRCWRRGQGCTPAWPGGWSRSSPWRPATSSS